MLQYLEKIANFPYWGLSNNQRLDEHTESKSVNEITESKGWYNFLFWAEYPCTSRVGLPMFCICGKFSVLYLFLDEMSCWHCSCHCWCCKLNWRFVVRVSSHTLVRGLQETDCAIWYCARLPGHEMSSRGIRARLGNIWAWRMLRLWIDVLLKVLLHNVLFSWLMIYYDATKEWNGTLLFICCVMWRVARLNHSRLQSEALRWALFIFFSYERIILRCYRLLSDAFYAQKGQSFLRIASYNSIGPYSYKWQQFEQKANKITMTKTWLLRKAILKPLP